jgi:hypothetical protein
VQHDRHGWWVRVLTEPVPDVLEQIGWTGNEPVTDLRTLLHYFRTTEDGRIVFGWTRLPQFRPAIRAALVRRDRAQDAGGDPGPATRFVASPPRRLGMHLPR